MPIPSSLYVAFQGLETLFRDKITGLPLSAGYVKFFSDVARSVPKNVFQQVRLPGPIYQFVNIGSTVTLNSIGAFGPPNEPGDIQVYAFPWTGNEAAPGTLELYYLEVYSSDNILQWIREAQPANAIPSSNTMSTFDGTDNQIENPQFVETLLPPSLTNVYTVAGANTDTPIAPDWSLYTSGSGTVTVTQIPLIDIVMPTGAPYALRISSSGIDSLKLRQNIAKSPRLMGVSYISSNMVAKSFTINSVVLSMDYVASNGYTVNLINASTTASQDFTTLQNAQASTLVTTNTDSPNAPGFVDIFITIPVGTDIALTSIQMVTVETANSSTEFLQISTPRQIDHLFHYYKPQIFYKPIPSYLVGWDFPLNPSQLFPAGGSIGATGANKSSYVWDQTIVFQTVDNSINFGRNSSTNALKITPTSDTSFAIIQYLPVLPAREILSQTVSAQLSAYITTGTINGTVSLWYTADATLPDLNGPNYNSLVSSISAGVPTAANGTWVQVIRGGLPASAPFSLSTTTSSHDFIGFVDTPGLGKSNAKFFAVVIAFDTMTAGNDLSLDYCSLVGGNIATRPAPQTSDEVLRECQYYYEKSYDNTIREGSNSTSGERFAQQVNNPVTGSTANSAQNLIGRVFGIQYLTEKRIIPNLVAGSLRIYPPPGPIGALGNVFGVIRNGGSAIGSGTGNIPITNWGIEGPGTKAVQFLPANVNNLLTSAVVVGNFVESYISFQYVADVRLGVV